MQHSPSSERHKNADPAFLVIFNFSHFTNFVHSSCRTLSDSFQANDFFDDTKPQKSLSWVISLPAMDKREPPRRKSANWTLFYAVTLKFQCGECPL